MRTKTLRLLVGAVVVAVLGFAVTASAGRPTPPWACECANVELPVLCSNGIVYINPCVAGCFGQTDCVPYGDPPPIP